MPNAPRWGGMRLQRVTQVFSKPSQGPLGVQSHTAACATPLLLCRTAACVPHCCLCAVQGCHGKARPALLSPPYVAPSTSTARRPCCFTGRTAACLPPLHWLVLTR